MSNKRNKNKNMAESKRSSIWCLPIVLAVAVVPLITVVKRYKTGLTHYAWFSDAMESTIDVFLYYKSYWMTVLAVLMVLMLGYTFVSSKKYKTDWSYLKCPEMICLAIYFVFSLASALFSQFGDVALFGGYEQWEGMNVIFAYVVLLFYVCYVADSDEVIRTILRAVIAGSAVVGAIGAFQYLHLDFFKTTLGQKYMSMMLDETLSFSFNFPEGQSYSTLYNPNYVGTYVVLVMPILAMIVFCAWGELKMFWNILAVLSLCLNFVALVGSRSLTGIVGVIACLVFVIIYEFPIILKKLGVKTIAATGGGIVVLCAVFVLVFPSQVKTMTDKLFHPNKDSHTIESMVSSKDGVKITTVDDQVLNLQISEEAGLRYMVSDGTGNMLELEKNSNDGGMMVKGKKEFSDIRFFATTLKIGDHVQESVMVQTRYNYKSWYICKVDGAYKLCNGAAKLDDLVAIPASGFEDNQHFGDKRGYIWSRTIPLLKDYIVLGSGPNTFTEAYPNNDYVGMNNLNYYGMTITKPHNMYLQTWVQTGLVSLLAYLGMCMLYLVRTMRKYYKKEVTTIADRMAVAIMVAVVGYLVTGIANDSTVAVAPLFWAMLGLGMAINRRK